MGSPRPGPKHQWPSDAPPGRTSTPESCAGCGLVRRVAPGPSGMRWYWRYGEKLSVLSGPCNPRPNKKLKQVINEVRQ